MVGINPFKGELFDGGLIDSWCCGCCLIIFFGIFLGGFLGKGAGDTSDGCASG